MTTYAQTTIHSKVAKFEKLSGDGTMGRVVKGSMSHYGTRLAEKPQLQPQIMKQISVLPKSKLNVARKFRNTKKIPGTTKNDEIILMESSIFPAIYFKKTTMRNVLKQFTFPQNCRALPPNDERTPLIYQIISNLFSQITFYIFNILIGQNLVTKSYYVFFSDSQTIPFTKCCNAPVFIELLENGSGKILCNAVDCPHPNLAEFLINFEDGRKLWKNITYFADAHEKDKELKKKIAKLIHNGKYKKMNLVNIVQDTSQQIVDLFYQSKNNQRGDENYEDDINPFVTGENILNQTPEVQPEQQIEMTPQDLISPEEKNIETLKMKLMYMTKRQRDINKRVSKSIAEKSKVFHKNFEMIKKIDEYMLKNRNSKTHTKISFPRIIDQMNKKAKKTHSQSMYDSFT